MVMVKGRSSAVVVEPLIPGSAPTMMPISVPRNTTSRILGSTSSAMPATKASIYANSPFGSCTPKPFTKTPQMSAVMIPALRRSSQCRRSPHR